MLNTVVKVTSDAEAKKFPLAIIGIDPGIRTPVTAYCLKQTASGEYSVKDYTVFQLSSKEWRKQSGITGGANSRSLYLSRMQPALRNSMLTLPSLKSLDLQDYRNHINRLQPIFSQLYEFYQSQPYLQLRMTCYSMKRSALALISKSILALGADCERVVIGMGNFRQRQGSPANKSNPSSPIQLIRQVIIYIHVYIYIYILYFCFVVLP